MSSTQDTGTKGIDKTADALKPATNKAAGPITDTAHHAGNKMKEAGQRVQDAAE